MRKPDGIGPRIDDLRCFVLAAESGSLTAAAAAEGMAQSAFSRQLARLEASLGGLLLHRTGRGVALSDLGQRVLPRAQALLAEAQALSDDAAGRWSRPSGVVEVALLPSLTKPLTARLYGEVRRAYPDVRLRVHEAYSGEVEAMLADGRADVGTFNRYRRLRRDAMDAVMTSSMCLIVARRHPLAAAGSVRFGALGGQALVMPLRPNGLGSVVEEIARRADVPLDVALEVDSSAAMKDAVIGFGLCAMLPAHAVQDELRRGEVSALPITHPAIRQATFVDTTRRRPVSAAVREVERTLRRLCRQGG